MQITLPLPAGITFHRPQRRDQYTIVTCGLATGVGASRLTDIGAKPPSPLSPVERASKVSIGLQSRKPPGRETPAPLGNVGLRSPKPPAGGTLRPWDTPKPPAGEPAPLGHPQAPGRESLAPLVHFQAPGGARPAGSTLDPACGKATLSAS